MRSLYKMLLQLACCSSGSVLVEMTIIVPLAISLMAGGVDFGLAISQHSTIAKSVRDAGRYLGTLPPSAVCGWGASKAQNLAVYGNLAGSGNPLIAGWQKNGVNNNVTITTDPANCASVQQTIIVTANVPYNSIILAAFLPIQNIYTLTAQHEEPSIGQ